MAGPAIQHAQLGPCPAEEELAAFLDGALTAAERARITAHLAGCPNCHEVFTGVAHFLSELEVSTPDRLSAQITRFSRYLQRLAPRSAGWHAAAIAAAVVAAIVVPAYRSLTMPPPMLVADLAAPLVGLPRIASHLRDAQVARGDRIEAGLLSAHPSFLIGVLEVDLRLSLAAGDLERSSRILLRIGALLRDVDFMRTQAEAYQIAAARLTSTQALRRVAATAPAQEAALEGKTSSLLAEWVAFGKWTEAGRLAAATRTSAFFTSRANRRFRSYLLQGRLGPLDPEVRAALSKVEKVWDLGRFAPGDFLSVEAELAGVIDRIETLLVDGEAPLAP